MNVRVKPSAASALVAILGYLVIVFAIWAITGLKYDHVGDTVDTVRKGITLSIGVGALYLIVVTTALGWWKPALREPQRVGSRWMWAVPVLLLAGAIMNLAATRWDRLPDKATYVLWLAIGTAFVGFSEELLTRGLAIVGGRGSMHEKWVWAFSGLIFGLLHAPNALFGQSLPKTVVQVFFAFIVGMTYYVTRRISGTLIVTMVLHALWDFAVFVQDRSVKGLTSKPAALGAFFLYGAAAVGVVALIKVLKTGDVVEPGGDQLAPLNEAVRPAAG